MRRKVTFIGGGSYHWVPMLFRDVAVNAYLQDIEFVLHDIATQRNDEMHVICETIKRKVGAKLIVSRENSLERALEKADAVVFCISTGGLDAMEHDLKVPEKYGVYQAVGDTTGPGGVSRTLRNLPIVLDVIKKMEAICPDAWFLNLTNPMSQIVRTVGRYSNLKVIGLCHEYIGFMAKIENLFGLKDYREETSSVIAGVNHFAWILKLTIRGEDGLALLRKKAEELGDVYSLDPGANGLGNGSDQFSCDRVKLWLMKRYEFIPYPGDRHIVEFFPYFLTSKTEYGKSFDVRLTTVEDRRTTWMDRFMERVELWTNEDPHSVPREPSQEHLAPILAALFGGPSTIQPLVLPNTGQVDNLPREASVETMGTVSANSICAHQSGCLPTSLLALTTQHVANQELCVEAAVEGNRAKALQAMLADPLNSQLTPTEIEHMLNGLLEANERLLPQFNELEPVSA